MHLDLIDDETRALLNLLTETIENDRYPLSPRIRMLCSILTKLGPMGPAPPPTGRPATPDGQAGGAPIETVSRSFL